MSLATVVLIFVVIICLVFAIIAIDYLAAAMGGDARLWALLKVLAVLIALVFVLERSGLV